MSDLIAKLKGFDSWELELGVWGKHLTFAGRRGGGRRRGRILDYGRIASLLEYGNHPSGKNWPFMEPSIRKNRLNWLHEFSVRLDKSVDRRAKRYDNLDSIFHRKAIKRSAKLILHNIGKMAVRDTKAYLWSVNSPPLAPSTVDKKGHAKPLVDTGTLMNAIQYRIVAGAAAVSPSEGESQSFFGGVMMV
tara:strand:- start:77 stop:646 length:570 start_codon:yes stop_codon:yes gene_type:complete